MPGIDLPELTFTAMEIEGNVLEQSFAAVIEAEIGKKDDKTWEFPDSGLTGIRLGLIYAVWSKNSNASFSQRLRICSYLLMS